VKDDAIAYQPTFKVKQLSLPVSRIEDLKKFYRIIARVVPRSAAE
jgi:hypothetical protein